MNQAINRHAGRFHLSESISRMLSDKGASHIGKLLGLDRGTVTDKGSDLHKWRVDELLILAEHSEEVAGALAANVRPAQTPGPRAEAVALHGDLMREIATSSELNAKIADSAADGRYSADERAEIRQAILMRRELDERVLADLDVQGGVQ